MMKRRPRLFVGTMLLLTSATACSDSGGTPTPPPMPTLGAQLDRDGRPGTAALLVGTFDPSNRDAARNAYNANANPSSWSSYAAGMQQAIGLFDGLDTTCGNALFASSTPPRYGQLGSVLADDRLYLDSSSAVCANYMSVEFAALTSTPSTDCGGRRLGMDVVDRMYTMLSVGPFAGIVTDGQAAPAGIDNAPFPYLAASH